MTFYRSDIRDAITLDFETEKIQSRPDYPPKPVGLALRYPDGDAEYMAWGHPTGNNCSEKAARSRLKDIFRTDVPKLFFNAKFDLAVACEKWGLRMPDWREIHDAMFLSFLADPHTRNLDLKSLAEDLLDWPAEERDAIAAYVWDNRVHLKAMFGGKINKKQKKQEASNAGEWLSKLPVKIVGPYGIGDIDRTFGLFEHLYPLIAEHRMCDAYDRERKVLPIFMENEREGMRVDLDALSEDVPDLRESLEIADDALRDMLDAPDLNIDADAQLAEALSSAGIVEDCDWTLTKTGQKSVSKDNLTFEMFQDSEVGHMYYYRNRLTTALSTFLNPWLEQAERRGGVISTNWNQVRGGSGGTRTGRPSTNNPNFLNIPKEFKQEYDMPAGNRWQLDALPFVRDYILPDEDELFLHRDFDGQEMRVFAHYEDGDLLQMYNDDPGMCPHEYVRDAIIEMFSIPIEKAGAKTLNFQGLYGGGLPALMKKLDCTKAAAKKFKEYHNEVLPGREELNAAIKNIINSGEPIRTWGNRAYFVEPPRVVNGRMQSFLYKLINYLCQGSAADITKEAIIRWYAHPEREARFLVTVYDEINISAAKNQAKRQMRVLKESMESIELDLQMTTSGKVGPCWGELEKCA